jgi:hypothetical protein
VQECYNVSPSAKCSLELLGQRFPMRFLADAVMRAGDDPDEEEKQGRPAATQAGRPIQQQPGTRAAIADYSWNTLE